MCQPGRPHAPRRRERDALVAGRLPQQEVERIALQLLRLLRHGVALEVSQPFAVAPTERAEVRRLRGVEKDVAVHFVSVPAIDQGRDHLDHLIDRLARPRERVRAQDVERVHLLEVDLLITLGQLRDGDAELARDAHHVVVNVGDVLDVPHLVGVELQVAADGVEADEHPRVAQVPHLVRRDAADVHAHDAVVQRLEQLFAPGERVVDLEQRAGSYRSAVAGRSVCYSAERVADRSTGIRAHCVRRDASRAGAAGSSMAGSCRARPDIDPVPA